MNIVEICTWERQGTSAEAVDLHRTRQLNILFCRYCVAVDVATVNVVNVLVKCSICHVVLSVMYATFAPVKVGGHTWQRGRQTDRNTEREREREGGGEGGPRESPFLSPPPPPSRFPTPFPNLLFRYSMLCISMLRCFEHDAVWTSLVSNRALQIKCIIIFRCMQHTYRSSA